MKLSPLGAQVTTEVLSDISKLATAIRRAQRAYRVAWFLGEDPEADWLRFLAVKALQTRLTITPTYVIEGWLKNQRCLPWRHPAGDLLRHIVVHGQSLVLSFDFRAHSEKFLRLPLEGC